MITMRDVELRLARAGMHNRFWGRAEMRELQHILMPEEEVVKAVNGRYEGGFAMIIASDRRLLLVDKKPLFLNMEDVRYDMISEVDFSARLFDATVHIKTINGVLRFTTMRQNNLRKLTGYMQQRIMDLRQQTTQQAVPMLGYTNLNPYEDRREELQQPLGQLAYDGANSYMKPQTFYATPTPARYPFPNGPLTVRRRVSRFYPVSSYKGLSKR